MDNCCDSLLKYLIFIFNFFFFLIGVGLLGLGLYIRFGMGTYLDFLNDAYMNTGILFIILGIVILVIAFFGCCGACTENACMMYTFASLLAIVVILQIGAGVAMYIHDDEAHKIIVNKMKDGLKNYKKENFNGVTDTWNSMQIDLKCCGVQNYTDWRDTEFSNGKDIPDSCCATPTENCGKNALEATDLSMYNQGGCFKLLVEVITENISTICGILVACVILQIIGVLVSCMLGNNMRRRTNYV